MCELVTKGIQTYSEIRPFNSPLIKSLEMGVGLEIEFNYTDMIYDITLPVIKPQSTQRAWRGS